MVIRQRMMVTGRRCRLRCCLIVSVCLRAIAILCQQDFSLIHQLVAPAYDDLAVARQTRFYFHIFIVIDTCFDLGFLRFSVLIEVYKRGTVVVADCIDRNG